MKRSFGKLLPAAVAALVVASFAMAPYADARGGVVVVAVVVVRRLPAAVEVRVLVVAAAGRSTVPGWTAVPPMSAAGASTTSTSTGTST